ncbi:poly-gamma-glutamate system protein [Limnochorda pilosa]|uniref:Poly-gamma-glutamate system protein n=1 Tax=Limnochorda pilosa TaxID=1555112 RepID=A0A0K2SHK0_LIMPI|nr:poly-gamma-glutamate system protein [Limnochorda pilosa]BAS26299.1 hypothetical protein LIP_0442 [Limnochorda pilosa]
MGRRAGREARGGTTAAAPQVLRPRQGRFPQPPAHLALAALLLLAGYYAALALGWLPPLGEEGLAGGSLPDAIRREAVARMARALPVLAEERAKRGFPLDPVADPNRTGLIGVEFTEITTTMGDPVAKRTAANPQWAGVLAEELWRAGARPGDVAAATLSGSFPGLNLAVFAAADALELHLAAVASLGASMWGANLPLWTWADMERTLWEKGLIGQRSLAYALGGEGDRGGGLLPEGVEALRAAVDRSGVPLLAAEGGSASPEGASLQGANPAARDLENAVQARLELFDEVAARHGARIAACVNVGGGQAALGRCPAMLALPPGLNLPQEVPACGPEAEAGVLSRMAGRGVPVIHLLNIRELALRSGLPIDPVPFPEVIPP